MLRPAETRTLDNAILDLSTARTELADHPDFTKLSLSDQQREDLYEESEVLMENYFKLENPTTINPIGLELKLQADINGVTLRGVIDRLELDADGELIVTDYKTGKAPSPKFQGEPLAQVHTYALLCQEMLGRRPKKVQLLYLGNQVAIVAESTDQTSRGIETKTGARWDAIKKACASDNFPTNASKLCNWCSYQAYCPEFGGDPAKAEELRLTETPASKS